MSRNVGTSGSPPFDEPIKLILACYLSKIVIMVTIISAKHEHVGIVSVSTLAC